MSFRRLFRPGLAALALATAACSAPGPAVGPTAGPGAASPAASPGWPVGSLNAAAVGPTGRPGRFLLAVYMVGSDLEDDVQPRDGVPDERATGRPNRRGAGTADLREIASALAALTPTERERVDVLAAFGGARQEGWVGMKVLDLQGLVRDAADGRFGNEADPAAYVLADPAADMGSAEAFSTFIGAVQARTGTSTRTLLDVWDHGNAFAGVGPDKNTGRMLGLDAMRAVLATTRFRADAVAFDACLMGSIEVAMAVRPAFDYMVASVDTEPAHGFDYERWLPEVARHPEASIPELLARLVDVYLDSPAHARSHGLTLGVIALAKVGAVAAAMDAWGQASAGGPGAPPQPLLAAAAQATAYGLYGVPSAPLAVDLGSFARAFRSGPGRAEAVALEAAVRGSVVYAREDDLGAGSSGLTTFAPTNREAFDVNLYNPQSASSATWYAMIARAMRAARSDVEPPEVGAEQEGFFEGQRGWTTTFADDGGLADVRALAAVELGGGEWVQAHQQEAASPASGRYFLPAWDRQVLVYADGQGGETLVPVEQLAGAAGRRLFRTPGTWNGQEASFYYLDDAGHAIRDVWVVPVEAHDRSNLELSREASLAPGDALTFTYELVDAQLGRRGTRPSAAVTFTSPAALRWVPHAGKARQALVATDLGGNRAAGTPREP